MTMGRFCFMLFLVFCYGFSFGFFMVYVAEYGMGFPAAKAALGDISPAETIRMTFIFGRDFLLNAFASNSPLDIIPSEWVLRPYSSGN